MALAWSRWFNDLLTPVILEADEGDWLADERLADLELRSSEGVVILGIYREDGTYVGAPSGEDRIVPGDTVIAYGKEDRLREMVDRDEDVRAAHRAARAEFSRTQFRERRRDPERERPVAE